MGQKWLDYYSSPRKRHMPLKRYRVRAFLPDGEEVFLIIRARSKKKAKIQALADYLGIVKAEVLDVLGKAREDDFFL